MNDGTIKSVVNMTPDQVANIKPKKTKKKTTKCKGKKK